MKRVHGIALALGLAATACTEHGKSPPAGSCTDEATMSVSSMQTFGPHDVGTVDICLRLDVSSTGGELSVRSDEVPGDASPWLLRLTDADGKLLKDGWDLSVGQSMPSSFAFMDVVIDPMQLDAVLHVTAKASPARTSLQVTLGPIGIPD